MTSIRSIHRKKFLIFCLCLMGAALAPAPGFSAAPDTLVIVVEDDAAPWSQPDGAGFANEAVIAAFKASGVTAKLQVVPYARCKRMVIEGDAAACFSMSPAPELAETVVMSNQPLFVCYADYFYNASNPPKVHTQADLPPKTTVGTVIGYEYPPAFEQLKQKGIITLDESPSEEMNLKKLVRGRVNLAIVNYNDIKSAEYIMTRAGVTGQVKVGFRAGVLNSYIGFSKKHSHGLWALGRFNAGFQIITANGELRRIEKAWIEKMKVKTATQLPEKNK